MFFVVAALSYLLGSMVTGVIYSHLRGDDIRSRDLPGGSGTFRQYGRTAAILVTLADALRGALAVGLTDLLAQELTWLATIMVVLGHCYPVFFGFRGGGGIATLLGALFVAAPATGLGMLAFGLAVIPLYKATLQKRLGLNAVPFASALTIPVGLLLARHYGGMYEVLGGGLMMGIRGVHMLAQGRAGQAQP
ncbi:glycerol-3-phosphate acyltransferase [Deinococcus sp.]|uniref:glycerol-3-phosphate acyltransferase n=1 Tax=Deinococcus sp. TaxID=47478 RepID=UPI0025C54E9B|nr:glycerol-3-phosphate acyltransferase [Deinococcus sp.]